MKPAVGRPRTPANLAYTAKIHVRMTQSERAWLAEQARLDQLSISEYTRRILLEGYTNPDALIEVAD